MNPQNLKSRYIIVTFAFVVMVSAKVSRGAISIKGILRKRQRHGTKQTALAKCIQEKIKTKRNLIVAGQTHISNNKIP